MSIIRITILTMLFILLATLPSQPTSAAVPNAPEQFSCANVTEIPQIECEALVALYENMNGPNWDDNIGWLVTPTPCSWARVTCVNNHVTELQLSGEWGSDDNHNYFGLIGDVPPEIGNLTNLTYLGLHFNKVGNRSAPPFEIHEGRGGGLSPLRRIAMT